MRKAALFALGLVFALRASVLAQVQITFLPPPMEGSLSMGIYDRKGKLVRVLHREAQEKEFTVGLNGFITKWDGRDDAGQAVPPGTYEARGFAVGGIGVEGVAIHGNDWIEEDDAAPRPQAVADIRPRGTDAAEVVLRLANGTERLEAIPLPPPQDTTVTPLAVKITDGKVALLHGDTAHDVTLGEGETAIDGTAGAGNCAWIIVKTPGSTEVRQYGADGEFLRRLGYAAGDPVPRRIVASLGDEQIVLLEENSQMQRVRSLIRSTEPLPSSPSPLASPSSSAPPAPAPTDPPAEPASFWKTVFEKSLWRGESFDAVKTLLLRPGGKPFVPEKEFVVKLIDNELLNNEPSTARVNIGFNSRGSFLQTTDGLPLRRITEAANLKWAVIDREGSGRVLTILQSDGTAVEEFRANKLANMMMFDAGDYEWDGK